MQPKDDLGKHTHAQPRLAPIALSGEPREPETGGKAKTFTTGRGETRGGGGKMIWESQGMHNYGWDPKPFLESIGGQRAAGVGMRRGGEWGGGKET